MGRGGVTYSEVQRTALELQGRGKNPTVDAVRAILGTGSKTTIAEHLRMWKAESQSQGTLPQELQALVSGLWERLHAQADQRVLEFEKTSTEQQHLLEKELAQLRQEHSTLQKELYQSQEQTHTERVAKGQCLQELQDQQTKQLQLQERHDALVQRLEDQKVEQERMHQLATHLQNNLEHYQQSIEKLHVEHRLQAEKEQINFQREKKTLQDELHHQQQQVILLEKRLTEQTLLAEQLQQQQSMLEQARATLLEQEQDHVQTIGALQERCEQAERTLQEQKILLMCQQQQLLDLEKQKAVLAEQSSGLEKALAQAEDKIEHLRGEKLFLAQEKAELQGYIRQQQRQITVQKEQELE